MVATLSLQARKAIHGRIKDRARDVARDALISPRGYLNWSSPRLTDEYSRDDEPLLMNAYVSTLW